MSNVINITKISGVINISMNGGNPKSFFGSKGEFNVNPTGDGYNILINGYPFSVLRTNLTVNGQAPTTISEGLTLLGTVLQ